MKRKFFNAKYSAIIAAGMLLLSLPMTANAQKNTDEKATVEVSTEAAAENSMVSEKEKTTETSMTKDKELKEEETKASEITEGVKETEDKTEKETKETNASEITDTETNATEKSTEDVVEETTAASEENVKEDTKETETTAEEETTVEETTEAVVKSEAELSEAIVGTWAVDERTDLYFGDDNKGKLILPQSEYAFSYKIKNDDQLTLKFTSSKASDATYTASVSGDTLKLIGGKGALEGTLELTRAAH